MNLLKLLPLFYATALWGQMEKPVAEKKYFYELTPKTEVSSTCDLRYEMPDQKNAVRQFRIFCNVFKSEGSAKVHCKNTDGREITRSIKISGASLLEEKLGILNPQAEALQANTAQAGTTTDNPVNTTQIDTIEACKL